MKPVTTSAGLSTFDSIDGPMAIASENATIPHPSPTRQPTTNQIAMAMKIARQFSGATVEPW